MARDWWRKIPGCCFCFLPLESLYGEAGYGKAEPIVGGTIPGGWGCSAQNSDRL